MTRPIVRRLFAVIVLAGSCAVLADGSIGAGGGGWVIKPTGAVTAPS